jgi:alanyl-tRNA synthetase
MLAQKKRAREARANIGGWDESSKSLLSDLPKTEFTGYTDYRSAAKVIAILTDAGSVDSVNEGDCSIILDRTPFYGEGGGQVGDVGTIYSDSFIAKVYDTKKTDGVYIHVATVANGTLNVGDEVTADIEDARRDAIRRNHSAAHLLQAALRSVLGNHVEQAGSYVNEELCRFDFTHFASLTSEEIAAVEALVNANILVANEIVTMETDIETAKKHGAMALFGEKYGKTVRMVKMGDFSTELCGGTHCDNTGKIGLFKITSESSVAAGVRRIEAVTGLGVLKLMAQKDALIAETAAELKVPNPADLSKRANQLVVDLHNARKEIEALNSKLASSKLGDILASAKQVGAVKLIATKLSDMQLDAARALADDIKANHADVVAVLAVAAGDKLNFIAVAGKDAVAAGAHAGKLVGAVAAATGGKGGGRPDSAMAGGKELSKIDEALALAESTLASMLK